MGLVPMCLWMEGRCGQDDGLCFGLVRIGELDVEKQSEQMQCGVFLVRGCRKLRVQRIVLVALARGLVCGLQIQIKLLFKGIAVLDAHGAQIKMQQPGWRGDNIPRDRRRNRRLAEGPFRVCAHVEAVDVFKEMLLVAVVDDIGCANNIEIGLAWHHDAVGLEKVVARIEHALEHVFVEQRIAHPFADNDIDLAAVVCEIDVFNRARVHLDDLAKSVCSHNGRKRRRKPRMVLDRHDFPRPVPRCPQRQYSRSCTDVHDDFVFDEFRCSKSVSVCLHSRVISKHHLMNSYFLVSYQVLIVFPMVLIVVIVTEIQ
eukprot:comp16105_c0_seq1/m.25362 comp16105_c0_seq1/g.25362  ORF comp16105_c0_seq1/g.25362 comp16105_c0_seq1/m.25362 type:complete len:314 (+) comp16105_c0_seq1:209-1150(+)